MHPGAPATFRPELSERRRERSLGQSVVVENVGGAGGTTGPLRDARNALDGYTRTSATWIRFDALAALPPTPDQASAAALDKRVARDMERLGHPLRKAGVKAE
ncbi:hypothetical protein GCM10007886_50770 [Methylobacterium gregans]|nr:tripartite tricarboxylate transporter substrate-binding protein [Methylobacterium gregans]GLS56891.1 hypothetical protein GCM10007886_50770 [Methylobacterium gregans]